MPKKISLAVTEFAVPVPRQGSIEMNSGFADAQSKGLAWHAKWQEQHGQQHNYRAEVKVRQQFTAAEFVFDVSGRMDGVYQQTPLKIEEIKTTFNLADLARQLPAAPLVHPYCLQLQTYGYFHWLKTGEIPELVLQLISTRTAQTQAITLAFAVAPYEEWLQRRLQELVIAARLTLQTRKRRLKLAAQLAFPFTAPRPGQMELIAVVEENMRKHQPMLIQAPTGLGKTVGILYPALAAALAQGQKVIYVTPKNSQHSVAENAVRQLRQRSKRLKHLTLTAKAKMCFKPEPLCDPAYCEYAKQHYTKLAQHEVPAKMAKLTNLSALKIRTLAQTYEVCPYELQFHGVKHVDVVIADYNYVFAPQGATQSLTQGGIGEKGKPNLVIDEFHNLPERGRDYFSPSLAQSYLSTLRQPLGEISAAWQAEALALLDKSIALIVAQNPHQASRPFLLPHCPDSFMTQNAALADFMARYLNSDLVIQAQDPVMLLSRYWSDFVAALENLTLPGFFLSYQPAPPALKITCCDAAFMLSTVYQDFAQVVGFSATLKPFAYYRQLGGLGLPPAELMTAEFAAPFSSARRKVMIIPQISSKYAERARNYPRIAQAIEKIIQLRQGNYFVFLPSFDFLAQVLACFTPPPGFATLTQTRGMAKNAVTQLLAKLREQTQAHVLFAVQGGVFAEGVDYVGEMAIGAFIVGPPLPNFDFEREQMKAYYAATYGASEGFAYAYTYPAMAKAVQAAGRVIRSETDAGLIVLMDDRFLRREYSQCLPQDWFQAQPQELVSTQILRDIELFWASVTTPA